MIAPLSRSLIPVAALLAALLSGLAPAAAQDATTVYRVDAVEVKAKGNTGAQAKNRAIALGRRKAFAILMRQITLEKDRGRLPRPSGETLRDLVAGFEIEDETAGAKEYSGRIAFRFDRAKVEQLLRSADVGFVQGGGRPVLMLPVWQEGPTPLLWDDPNPWRQAWRRAAPANGPVRYAQARGDLKDLQAISGQQALQLDRDALASIARRYKADVVLVSHARREGGGVRVRVIRFDAETRSVSTLGSYESGGSDAAMVATAKKIAAAFEATWKTSNVVPTGPSEKLTVVAPLSGLAYWIRLRDTMARVPAVRDQRIIRLSPAEAQIEITYVGGLAELRAALRRAGISLTEGTTDEKGDPLPGTVRLVSGTPGGPDRTSGTGGGDRVPAPPPPDRVTTPAPNTQ